MSAAKTLMSASAAILVAATTPALAGPILDDIKANDSLICLVSPTAPGFSVPDSTGIFQGFNADFCRMAAAAVLGDASKADIRGVGFSDSMKTIVAGEAHMGSRSITRTGTRDADEGMAFVVTTFFDGQGFMVPRALGVTSATELDGASVCAEDGSTTLLNIADWFGAREMTYRVENIADKTARLEAFFSGKCDVYASDVTALTADRQLAPDAGRLRHPARNHLERAAYPGRAPRPSIRGRALLGLSGHAERRQLWHQFDQYRRGRRRLSPTSRLLCSASSAQTAPPPTWPPSWVCRRTGPTRSSSRSDLMARCSTVTLASTRPLP